MPRVWHCEYKPFCHMLLSIISTAVSSANGQRFSNFTAFTNFSQNNASYTAGPACTWVNIPTVLSLLCISWLCVEVFQTPSLFTHIYAQLQGNTWPSNLSKKGPIFLNAKELVLVFLRFENDALQTLEHCVFSPDVWRMKCSRFIISKGS